MIYIVFMTSMSSIRFKIFSKKKRMFKKCLFSVQCAFEIEIENFEKLN